MVVRDIRARRLARWLGILGPDLDTRIERGPEWRLDYLFSIGAVSWIIHLFVTLLASAVLLRAEPGRWLLGWVAAMALLSLLMAGLAVAYRRKRKPSPASAYGVAHSILTGFAGVAWGVGAILCALHSSSGTLTFYTLVLGGTALGAVSSQHVLMRSCTISIWTSVPLLAAAWLVHGDGPDSVPTAIIMLLFGVMLTVLAVRMNDFVVQNVELANELTAKNTQLIRTSEQLVEAHGEKSRFLAQASHDLRQPIHAIGLFVAYLGSTRMNRDGREVLANIERSLESLNRLCRSLLDLAALDVGRVIPDMRGVALADVMGEVVRQAGESARGRNVVLRYRSSRYWVRTDPALLHTMIQNLVSNAIKYAPGSQLLVGVRRRQGRLAVVVADTGPGIAETDQSRVFQEFVQLRAPGVGETDGLGLGLSIVKRLADMMGLRITLASREAGGARFEIEGLDEVAPGVEKPERTKDRHMERLKGLRVLVIDDDKAARDSTVQLLARWGCEATASEQPDVDMDGGPDFLLCDQELAGGDTGLEAVRRIRAKVDTCLAAAIVTGGRTDHIAEACRRESIILLTKPIRPAQLRSVLLAGVAA